jgi:hypothetical protein
MTRQAISVWCGTVATVLGLWTFAYATGFGVLTSDRTFNGVRACDYLVATGFDTRIRSGDMGPCLSMLPFE